MADDKPDHARRIVVPPPLIYLGPLMLGLLLGKAIPLLFATRPLPRPRVSGGRVSRGLPPAGL